ncbi:MAG: ATP-binding protein [Anaerolineae bacterium]|nr:ATP-binding protein [Anaerolineae bacterium]
MDAMQLRVLIVEDSEDDTLLLVRELQRSYKVVYQRVEERLGFCRMLAESSWDLVISDWSLPDFSALEALRLLQEHGHDVPFMIISGVIGEEFAVEGLRAGAHDFFLKKNTARLLPAIERELREAQDRKKRHEIEKQYRDSETRFHLAVKSAQLMVWEWDLNTNQVEYQETDNHALMFGFPYDPTRSDYHNFMQAVHPEDRAPLERAARASIEQALPYSIEFRVFWPDQSVHWLRSNGRIYYNDRGEADCLIGVLQNITDQKQFHEVEVERERLSVALEKERELTQLRNRFMTMAAHEFRTPLTVISTACELIIDYYDELTPERRIEYLHSIRGRIKYLRDMLTEIESVAREEYISMEFHPTPVVLPVICQRIIDDVREAYVAQHTIKLNAPPDAPAKWVDERLFTYILTNLLSNAIKYSKKNATIEVKLRYLPQEILLEVSDQGIGIPSEDQTKIFELFYRGANIGAVGGRGVGLKIVRDCVEVHRGTIEIESQVGVGSTFRVRLPQ